MSTQHDPVEILIDDSEDGMQLNGNKDEEEEYNVEAIRQRRKTKNGGEEYLIKWENFPESDNTWEPLENLKCPELIAKFNENEANKRRRRKAEKAGSSSQQPAQKRQRRDTGTNYNNPTDDGTNEDNHNLFLENDEDDYNEDRSEHDKTKSKKTNNSKEGTTDLVSLKGFERGLPIERILTASVGDDNKLYFFLKWQGRNDIEMVEADELEKNGSYELCRWYRERLYWEQRELSLGSQ